MTAKSDAFDDKQKLINKLAALFDERLPKQQATLVAKFARQYLAYTSVDDLLVKDLNDLYGALMSHWSFLYARQPGETKLRVYNPTFADHGWQSTHTIIELAQDDMPFIVDSMQMEINRLGFTIHFTIHVGGMQFVRDQEGKVIDVLPLDTDVDNTRPGAPVYIEIDRQTDETTLMDLRDNLLRVLSDVQVAVADWQKVREKVQQTLQELEEADLRIDAAELAEVKDFLRWIENDHFTFLGCRDYELAGIGKAREVRIIKGTGLGVLRDERATHSSRSFAKMPIEVQRLALSADKILIVTKTNTISTIHRPVHTDYIGIKLFNKRGKVIGERRFVGLYTSTAYNSNPKHIPFLRRKVAVVLQQSQLPPTGHAGKALLNILETLPRDDLFQASANELLALSMGILQMQDRQRIRLFVRRDVYGRFVSCLVYVPRDRFNTTLRQQIQQVLLDSFNGTSANFFTQLTDSVLACIHFIVRIDPKDTHDYDIKQIESRITDVARTWQDDLQRDLLEHYGEENGLRLFKRYCHAIPAGYIELFTSRAAVFDIAHIEDITDDSPLTMSFAKSMDDSDDVFGLKLYTLQTTAVLSDVLPILENMGLRVLGERSYRLRFSDTQWAWINDFSFQYCAEHELGVEEVRSVFQDAFKMTWFGHAENDGFNRLVLDVGMTWQQVCILRAYAKYCRQIGFTYSQRLIEQTLATYPKAACLLVKLFSLRFDPTQQKNSAAALVDVESELQTLIDSVTSLDQDRILRRYHELIMATLRTNYYQKDAEGKAKSYISFKFDPAQISDMPLPRPMYEIFVYSPRFEGVHLRGAKVARGGLRWSDRSEDFRTEVLGLMKAQQVKNALIVPLGAKGGFVAKRLPQQGGREAVMEEGIYCYQNFIRGLLDITDNLIDGRVATLCDTVCHDEDDTYLVVAADKGTATFSDLANEIAAEYGFWLGDAFASGGHTGYDHKKMAITARGGWESVKHHFRALDLNVQQTPFTVIGIGDMAGDVFGNGMLLSRQIKLVAAFNHLHIFIDPNPDPKTSFTERERLFNMRGGWSEYNKQLISTGGGVFSRRAKSIQLTPEIKALLGVEQDSMIPTDLMQAILTAPVDLFWNGGIGTFVKAQSEQHSDVGDRANDLIRVNADQLRCRVIGEGGNLGLTQLARVEYALQGGLINTDFIDNSAGVDCSDHEVNIKILLNGMVQHEDMTQKQRNELLADMTEEVAELVLSHNYHQCQTISALQLQSKRNLTVLTRYMQAQQRAGRLNCELEFLPNESALAERKANGMGLTRPEIAVLLAYSKNITKQDILNSDIPEDPYLARAIVHSFHERLREKYCEHMQQHTLRRDMIATRLSNLMTDDMGISFVYQLHNEQGASISAIVRAYVAARQVFNIKELWQCVSALDYHVNADLQAQLLIDINRLTRRSTRWFLRNCSTQNDLPQCIDQFHHAATQLLPKLPDMVVGQEKADLEVLIASYIDAGVPNDSAVKLACTNLMFAMLDIIDGANHCNVSIDEFGYCYFVIGDKLELSWVMQQVMDHLASDYWTAIARIALRDDIDSQRRDLTVSVLKTKIHNNVLATCIEKWTDEHAILIERWHALLAEMRSASVDLTRLSVAVRVLMDLSQINFHAIMEKG